MSYSPIDCNVGPGRTPSSRCQVDFLAAFAEGEGATTHSGFNESPLPGHKAAPPKRTRPKAQTCAAHWAY